VIRIEQVMQIANRLAEFSLGCDICYAALWAKKEPRRNGRAKGKILPAAPRG
jgi:hypothetical protein